jgi:hypothetical protein
MALVTTDRSVRFDVGAGSDSDLEDDVVRA